MTTYASFASAPRNHYVIAEIDPPWHYADNGSRASPAYEGAGRKTSRYLTLPDDEVAALPVGDLLASSAIVALWVTNSVLVDGRHLPILRAWGLSPKQLVPWVKTTQRTGAVRFGMGHYTRVCSEHLIYAARAGDLKGAERCLVLATRGRATSLVGDRSVAGVLVGPPRSGTHSSKPDAVRDLLDALVPEGPRVEIFARVAREGWDAIGDQVAAQAGAVAS